MKNNYRVEGDIAFIKIYFKGEYVETMVDAEDIPRIMEVAKGRTWNIKDKGDYKYVFFQKYGTKEYVRLHRILMDTPSDRFVDHINRNTLDNRKNNLRNVEMHENNYNRKVSIGKTHSGIKGIVYDNTRKQWRVRHYAKERITELGRFSELDEAIKVLEEFANEKSRVAKTHILGT